MCFLALAEDIGLFRNFTIACVLQMQVRLCCMSLEHVSSQAVG